MNCTQKQCNLDLNTIIFLPSDEFHFILNVITLIDEAASCLKVRKAFNPAFYFQKRLQEGLKQWQENNVPLLMPQFKNSFGRHWFRAFDKKRCCVSAKVNRSCLCMEGTSWVSVGQASLHLVLPPSLPLKSQHVFYFHSCLFPAISPLETLVKESCVNLW